MRSVSFAATTAGVVDKPRQARSRRLAVLDEQEALFVESAFELLLPEQELLCDAALSRAAEFVDERLQAGGECLLELHVDEGVSELLLTGEEVVAAYRQGIEAVARHCDASHGKVFHLLAPRQRHEVLGLLERESPEAGLRGCGTLFSLLLQHATEAYFAAANVHLARRTPAACALRAGRPFERREPRARARRQR